MLRAVIVLIAMGLAVAPAMAEQSKVLFLNKSAGFQHPVIVPNGDNSHAGEVMIEVGKGIDAVVEETKDASKINAESLKNYDVVVFYTTGDLTQPGTDGTTPMGENGLAELLAWIEDGGGFIGYHSASDTFHSPNEGPPSDFIEMIGGEFRTHGPQFKGTVRVVDSDHPTMHHVTDGWYIRDEWYMFRNLNDDKLHVLALLDPGKARDFIEMYNVPDYPIIWCREYGKGRVYYNAMGHRPDVWSNTRFQKTVADAIKWARGEGPTDAAPNFETVVPETIEETDKPAEEQETPEDTAGRPEVE